MKMYEIVGDLKALYALVESLTDEETGETRQPTDEERAELAAWFSESSEALSEKFDRVCKFYSNLRASADVCAAERDAMKAEMDRLSKRAKARENEAKSVAGIIWYMLDSLKMQKYKTDLFSAGIQNTAASVRVGNSLIPEEKVPYELPDEFTEKEVVKSAIIEALKRGDLYQKPVSTDKAEIESGHYVSPLDDGVVFYKEGSEEKTLPGIKYLSGKTCIIR